MPKRNSPQGTSNRKPTTEESQSPQSCPEPTTEPSTPPSQETTPNQTPEESTTPLPNPPEILPQLQQLVGFNDVEGFEPGVTETPIARYETPAQDILVLPTQEADQYFITPPPNLEFQAPTVFGLVVVVEAELPRLERFETKEELARRISELVGSDTYLFPFVGKCVQLTSAAPWRIQLPDGHIMDVTPQESAIRWSEDGFVGTRPQFDFPEDLYDETAEGDEEDEDDEADAPSLLELPPPTDE